MAKDELHLKKSGGAKVRMHPALFTLVLLIALVAGYAVSHYSLLSKIGIGDKNNCIPQSDLQFFIDKANTVQDNYAGCVKDAWNLQLACKQNIASLQNQIAVLTNATK